MENELPIEFVAIDNRRAYMRKVIWLRGEIKLDNSSTIIFVAVYDISPGGVKISPLTPVTLEVGAKAIFSLHFGDEYNGEEMVAQDVLVVWKKGPFYGLKFVDISEELVATIRNFVATEKK